MKKIDLNKVNDVMRATTPQQQLRPTTIQKQKTPTTFQKQTLQPANVSEYVGVSPMSTTTTSSTAQKNTIPTGVQSGSYTPHYIEPPQGQTEQEQKVLDAYADAYNYGENLKNKFATVTSVGIQANMASAIETQASMENQIVQEEIANSISGGRAYTQEDANMATQRANEEYTKNLEKALSTSVDMASDLGKNILDIQKAQITTAMDTALIVQKERQWQEEMALKQAEFELAKEEFEFQKQQWEEEFALMQEQLELSEEEFQFMKDQWEEEFEFMKQQWEEELEFMYESLG